jgi:hypothetical protein
MIWKLNHEVGTDQTLASEPRAVPAFAQPAPRLRQAGPTFDASLALEFMGFVGPELKEGLAALAEKRPPAFQQNCPL